MWVKKPLYPGYHIKQADVVVVAAGKKELVKGEWIKPGSVVIDCGINPEPDATKKTGVKLWGDVEYPIAKQVCHLPMSTISYRDCQSSVNPLIIDIRCINVVFATLRIAIMPTYKLRETHL